MIWWIEQIDGIFVYWKWWISIEATNISYFGLALSGIGFEPTRLSDEKLEKLKNCIFCFHWSYKKYTILGYTGKFLGQSVCRFFTFDLLLVNLNTRDPLLHCTCFFGFHGFYIFNFFFALPPHPHFLFDFHFFLFLFEDFLFDFFVVFYSLMLSLWISCCQWLLLTFFLGNLWLHLCLFSYCSRR